jgi:methylenetetrahydrofolate reductase (NADPH)
MQEKKTYSFEFFPARTDESAERLSKTVDVLAGLNPRYFSVTFGAGGGTRDKTFETVMNIREKTNLPAAPHLSCIGFRRDEIKAILQTYKSAGIREIVALRGDLPSGSGFHGELRYASELVELIREETGDYFHIEVAAYPEVHPQSQTANIDLQNFKRKVDAGANGALTQYFYNADAYFRFVDECEREGIEIPIIPGIMPIINFTQLMRFSEACGAEIPRWIVYRLRDFGDDRVSIKKFGVEVATELCRQLLDQGAPGLHFYTMNQHDACTQIWDNLSLPRN